MTIAQQIEQLEATARYLIRLQLKETEELLSSSYEGDLLIEQVADIRKLKKLADNTITELTKLRRGGDVS